MKTKRFGHGKLASQTYIKKVGNGFETGFTFNGKTIFVGNFIHAKEATVWFGTLNREILKFCKKYPVGTNFPATWFFHFVGTHLYKAYYGYVNTLMARHNRIASQAVVKDLRKYRAIKKNWTTGEVAPVITRKAA